MTSHMLEEIGEAGDAVARQLGANAEPLAELGARLRALDPPLVTTIARGSSDCCALYLKYLVEIVAGVPCASIGPSIATLYHAPMRLSGAVSVAISQSGQSPDIVAMQRAVRRGGALAIALVNEVASPLAREAEALLPLGAGPERSVAATKSMIAGLVGAASLVAAWREVVRSPTPSPTCRRSCAGRPRRRPRQCWSNSPAPAASSCSAAARRWRSPPRRR